MSASLVVLAPIILLGLVTALCFVGCYTDVQVSDFGEYEGTILGTPNLVAFWPLDDTSGTIAVDRGPNNFNGGYIAATGAITLNQPGIVAGDKVNNKQSPCILVDGGFVEVLYQAALNPQPPFTLEAWVVANWTASDPPAVRTVVESAVPPNAQGFDLFATSDNYWAAAVGTSSGIVQARPAPGSNQTIMLNSVHFLVMTYDGASLTLWVDPVDIKAAPYAQVTQAPGTSFVPAPSPIPLYIGTGRPDLSTGPQNPFNGNIQDVAFYNAVLDLNTIVQHYVNGNGVQMT